MDLKQIQSNNSDRQQIQYNIKVKNKTNEYSIIKKYSEIYTLHVNLELEFKSKLPVDLIIIKAFNNLEDNKLNSNSMIQNKIKNLEI